MTETVGDATKAESSDSSLEQDKPGRFWVMWIVLALVVYVLSVGPAVRLAVRMPASKQGFLRIYAPLSFVANHCPPVKSFFEWYVGLWMPPFFGGLQGGW
jgi:hypothetical protein